MLRLCNHRNTQTKGSVVNVHETDGKNHKRFVPYELASIGEYYTPHASTQPICPFVHSSKILRYRVLAPTIIS